MQGSFKSGCSSGYGRLENGFGSCAGGCTAVGGRAEVVAAEVTTIPEGGGRGYNSACLEARQGRGGGGGG